MGARAAHHAVSQGHVPVLLEPLRRGRPRGVGPRYDLFSSSLTRAVTLFRRPLGSSAQNNILTYSTCQGALYFLRPAPGTYSLCQEEIQAGELTEPYHSHHSVCTLSCRGPRGVSDAGRSLQTHVARFLQPSYLSRFASASQLRKQGTISIRTRKQTQRRRSLPPLLRRVVHYGQTNWSLAQYPVTGGTGACFDVERRARRRCRHLYGRLCCLIAAMSPHCATLRAYC